MTATGSYLHARSSGSRWLLRMEDLDRDREVAGAASRILATLESFGFEWDGPVAWQSRRTGLYEAALDRLRSLGAVYECACTRNDLRQLPRNAWGEPVYPGTCRRGAVRSRLPPAVRVRTDLVPEPMCFEDEFQGRLCQRVAEDVGDFVVRRRDGFFAYQLAVVVDDAEQGVTEVVRGADLFENTPRQLMLQRLLGLPEPRYAHLPLVVEPGGQKLSKSRRAVALDPAAAAPQLVVALRLLQQNPPADLAFASVREVWSWALSHWQPAALVACRSVEAPPRGSV